VHIGVHAQARSRRVNTPVKPAPSRCREELNQPVFAAIDAFEYPELHDESIATRNFLRHLGKLMASTGVKDFTMKVGPPSCSRAPAARGRAPGGA
jgi:hypothetical protein